ncbi:MAG: response regulator [Chloroflexi bacterium]|nr:response regulator [Chloroflexota bacterium]MDA1269980.1 response regulator [Chloroflexota bacterium]
MPRKIMLADDEEGVLALVAATLEDPERYELILVDNGDDALHTARAEMPDLLFLDVMMPYKDGVEVCRLLKNDPATASMKIVMLTAMSQSVDRTAASLAGADDYFTKPFSPTALLEKVDEVLGESGD